MRISPGRRPPPIRWAPTSWARRLRLAQAVALLVTLTFGWRVSAAFASPCVDERPAADAPADGRAGDGCCPGEARSRAGDVGEAPAGGDRSAADGDRASTGDGHDEGHDCSCPVSCSPCCRGALAHALPPIAPPSTILLAELVPLPKPGASSGRADAAPLDILHVPRPR